MVDIIKIDDNNKELIRLFLNSAGSSLKTFRYFNKRALSVINQHLITCLLKENDCYIGYGHLDYDNENIWLGIAIIENSTKKGYGSVILNYLLDFALNANIKVINLSVDKSNINAIKLYTKFNFKKTFENDTIQYMQITLSI